MFMMHHTFACIVLLCTWFYDIFAYRMEEQGEPAVGPIGSFESVHAYENVPESPVHDATPEHAPQ